MQQIADWLERLGLGQYAQRFAENDIDFEVLSDLTDQDLEKIGVASVGHRRKLLRAIANLKGLETITPAVAIAAGPPATPRAADTAERRQVTVMFSDLVGSTALSARMDPEDLRELISAYHKCVAEAVRRFGGFVARYFGDGVLVYFGYPEAHEDDAERAVRAGLDLIAAVIALKTPTSLQTRVGIATGLVIVGDLTGSGEAQERGVVGETPNLAARLQGIAEPNTVVIAETTRNLVGNLFELEDLGAQNLKGIAGPVRVWAAQAGLLFQQGVPPHASYLFKHALVQDAAYGTLLREPRRALHARIAETLANRFADVVQNQPELVARHYTDAGLIQKAVSLWRKAGLRSLERSASLEAAAQLSRARDQISTLPTTLALRREEIEVQVALITALRISRGHAAPEPKAAAERARLLIETAVALGEPPDDPLLLFSVLFGFFVECTTAFNANAS